MVSDPYKLMPEHHQNLLDLAYKVKNSENEMEIVKCILDYRKYYNISWNQSVKAILGQIVSQSLRSEDRELIGGPIAIIEAILENENTPMDVLVHPSLIDWYTEKVACHPMIPMWALEYPEELASKIHWFFHAKKLIPTQTLEFNVLHTNEGIDWMISRFIDLGAPHSFSDFPRIQKKSKRSGSFSEKDWDRWKVSARQFIIQNYPEDESFGKEMYQNHEAIRSLRKILGISRDKSSGLGLYSSIINGLSTSKNPSKFISISEQCTNIRKYCQIFGKEIRIHPLSSILEENFEARYQQWLKDTDGLNIFAQEIGRDSLF